VVGAHDDGGALAMLARVEDPKGIYVYITFLQKLCRDINGLLDKEDAQCGCDTHLVLVLETCNYYILFYRTGHLKPRCN
jgi:hypothetical protein